MIEIQGSEAKTNLPQLLTRVEQGETILITRHGKPIVLLAPETRKKPQWEQALQAIENLQKFRKKMPQIALERILAWRHQGHKH